MWACHSMSKCEGIPKTRKRHEVSLKYQKGILGDPVSWYFRVSSSNSTTITKHESDSAFYDCIAENHKGGSLYNQIGCHWKNVCSCLLCDWKQLETLHRSTGSRSKSRCMPQLVDTKCWSPDTGSWSFRDALRRTNPPAKIHGKSPGPGEVHLTPLSPAISGRPMSFALRSPPTAWESRNGTRGARPLWCPEVVGWSYTVMTWANPCCSSHWFQMFDNCLQPSVNNLGSSAAGV